MKPSRRRESRAWLPWEKWYENGAKPARPVDMDVHSKGGVMKAEFTNVNRDTLIPGITLTAENSAEQALLQLITAWEFKAKGDWVFGIKRERSTLGQEPSGTDEIEVGWWRLEDSADIVDREHDSHKVGCNESPIDVWNRACKATDLLRRAVRAGVPISMRDLGARMVPAIVMRDIRQFLKEHV